MVFHTLAILSTRRIYGHYVLSRILWTGREAVAMSKVFHEVEQAALALAISVEELEEMISTEELRVVRVGDRRRLVRVAEVEALLEQVKSGKRLRTRREFRAATVEKALAQAASRLNAAPHLLTYKVLEEGGSWRPGTDGQRARIMVELPADETPDRQDETAGTAASRNSVDGGASEGEKGAYYYAPGQVARLLGTDLHEINLWIYLKELVAVDINGYRWVPKTAVNERLIRASGPKLEDPPRPFFIVTPGEPEITGYSRLGTREVIAGESLPSPELLKLKMEGFEEEIRNLREELRIEKMRQSREPQVDQTSSVEGAVERLARRTGLMPGPAENPA